MELVPLSYLLTTLGFVILLAKLFSIWRGQLELFLYIVAVLCTTLWAIASFIHFSDLAFGHYIANTLDLIRNVAWIIFLLHILKNISKTSYPTLLQQMRPALIFFVSGLLISFSTIYVDALSAESDHYHYVLYIHNIGHLALLCGGLLLIKRFVAHKKDIDNPASFIMLGAIFLLFIVDFIYFAAALIAPANDTLITLRPLITTITSIALLISTSRIAWSKSVCISHDAANRFVLFLLTIVYLIGSGVLMLSLRQHSEQWGAIIVSIVSLGIALLYISVFSSQRRRAQLKVFLNKHFFNYKYDYRDEWLGFTSTLSRGGAGAHLLETVIEALSKIVTSRGGMLWLNADDGSYTLTKTLNVLPPDITQEAKNSSLVVFLKQWQWIINLDEYQQDPGLYQDLTLPPWLLNNNKAWLIVPLMQDIELLGFVVIARPDTQHNINWEDHDLLKTAGRQAATHLAQLMTVQALVEAREFQAFSKLSAFVIHDLKNLVAQLSLVVTNAAKHKHNPEFMDDAINTVDHSVSKMNRLLTQLRQGRTTPQAPSENTKIELNHIINNVIDERCSQTPQPSFHSQCNNTFIAANADRMSAVLEHIIQNAQEATPADGWVKVTLSCEDNLATIKISDNGCGMDQAFINNRLFRPFDTTKGQGGMGIGVYESREYVQELKGSIHVSSEPGSGTSFTISLPIT